MALLPPGPPGPAPIRFLSALVDHAVVLIGAAMVGLVFVNVVLHVFHHDIAWTIEFCEFMMVWASFLGGAAATRRGAHMTITEFIDKLHGRSREAADAAVNVLALVVLGALVWYGGSLAVTGWTNELTVLQIPMSVQYAGMPVGCLAMLVWIGWDLVRIARGDPREARWPA